MTRSMHIADIEPTVFFARHGTALRQVVRVSVQNRGMEADAVLSVRADGVDESLSLGTLPPGDVTCEVLLPDIRSPIPVSLGLWVAGVLKAEQTVTWQPQKHWEVHLIQYAHHDLGYTDLPSNVLAEYNGFMDQVLQYCAETERWPEEDARFRYQCEQAWSVVHYVENRPRDVVERLVRYVQKGQIEVTALFGNQTLELCGHEELIRLLYPAFRLKHEQGIEISSAEHNDIPGFTWGLASVLAGAGVRYFSPGVPPWYYGRGEERVHPLWDTEEALPLGVPAACWWEGPDGARVLLWSDIHGVGEWQPYNLDQAVSELPEMLRGLEERDYPYDMVSYTLRGGHRDNAPPTIRYAYLAKEWNARWAYPRLINTTNTPFLKAFETRWGSTLKTLRGDVPGTDYPVAATCTPKETAVDRNTHEWLVVSEKLATLASIVSDTPYPRATLEKAYRDTFNYDLHCWGLSHIGGPAQDGHWSEKSTFAYQAAALAHDVMVKAGNAILDKVTLPEEAAYVSLFSSLSHERTDVARVPLRTWGPCGSPMHWREPSDGGEWPVLVSGRAMGRRLVNPPATLLDQPFELVDASTEERVPYQVSTLQDPQAAERWAPERVALGKVDPRHLSEIVFVAEGLPSLGYRTYQLVPCTEWPTRDGAAVREDKLSERIEIENRFYRLEVDRQAGAIASLFDKELERELVDPSAAHGFGTLVVRSSETAEEETVGITDAAVSDTGPVFTTVRIKGETPSCPRVTLEITLYHAVKRIDLGARILRDSTPMREVYLAFPFQVEKPRFRFEAPNAVIEPIHDQWPGSCTDCYAVQHWADVYNDDWGVVWTPVDTPMAEFGRLWPGYVSGAHHGVRGPGYGHPFLQPGELKRSHIYSLVSYSNFRTNFCNVQPGECLVRYAFSSHAGDWRGGRAQHFGSGAVNPPLAVWMNGPQEGTLPLEASFCQIDVPNVVLVALKPAEDGNGTILRLRETEGKETTATVALPHISVRHAFETNLVEENRRVLACTAHGVQIGMRPFSINTIRVHAEL